MTRGKRSTVKYGFDELTGTMFLRNYLLMVLVLAIACLASSLLMPYFMAADAQSLPPSGLGSAVGRVSAVDSTAGLVYADIYLINTQTGQSFRTMSDAMGYFQLSYVPVSTGLDYVIYASDRVAPGTHCRSA
jgi:hypothetical protein